MKLARRFFIDPTGRRDRCEIVPIGEFRAPRAGSARDLIGETFPDFHWENGLFIAPGADRAAETLGGPAGVFFFIDDREPALSPDKIFVQKNQKITVVFAR